MEAKVNQDLTIEPVDVCENRSCVFMPLMLSQSEALGMNSGNFGTGTLIPQGMQPDNANVTWRVYYPGGGLRVQTTTGDALSYLVQDHLNSTSLTLNTSGSITGEMVYSAWGETRYSFGATPTDRLYTGQYEAEAGLYFYNARWYDNQLGRFTQADSIVPGPGNPQSWDRYAYVKNNPVRYSDPTGHYEFENDPDDPANLDWAKNWSNPITYNLWDLVPVVTDIRQIVRGSQNLTWASKQPGFENQQSAMQDWYNNCYGQCHYQDFVDPGSQQTIMGGPMPHIPLVDKYSEGMGDVGSGVTDLIITTVIVEVSLSKIQIFSKGGASWHLGLETKNNMNIIHLQSPFLWSSYCYWFSKALL